MYSTNTRNFHKVKGWTVIVLSILLAGCGIKADVSGEVDQNVNVSFDEAWIEAKIKIVNGQVYVAEVVTIGDKSMVTKCVPVSNAISSEWTTMGDSADLAQWTDEQIAACL